MKPSRLRRLAALALAVSGLCLPAGLHAETFPLKLKTLEDSPSGFAMPGGDYLFRMTSSQHFWMQSDVEMPRTDGPAFSAVIKKEPPKYACEYPFRCVAKLGSDNYGFVLDATQNVSKGYDRLYFDRNHNGDLTDDQVIKARSVPFAFFSSSQREFPRINLTINVDGKKLDYAFFLSVYASMEERPGRKPWIYASARLNPAVYRDGEVTINGKRRRIVLLDYNSNGRFDDKFDTRKDIETPNRQVYIQTGDMLLIDPDTKNMSSFGYGVTDRPERQHVSRLVNIDDRFYELMVSPTGETMTLTASSLPIAQVASTNERYVAVVYGDKGLVKISGGKAKPAVLPVGDWKLLSYRIDLTGLATQPLSKPAPKKETPASRPAAKPSLASRFGRLLFGSDDSDDESRWRPQFTFVSAEGTRDCPTVSVREGKTALLRFGPPFKPVVRAAGRREEREVRLEMSLVGCAGEICTDMWVNGDRPAAPRFEIATKKGDIVARGKFEFG
jgi:hypothetical protein